MRPYRSDSLPEIGTTAVYVEQVRRGDPGVVFEAVQLGHDARHGGADDGLVERGQQQAHHQAATTVRIRSRRGRA